MRMTVGSLPSTVYWRRRAIVLGAVLLLIVLTVWACGGSGDASPTPTAHQRSASPQQTGDDRYNAMAHGTTAASPSSPGTASRSPASRSPDPTATSPAPSPTGPPPTCPDGQLSVVTALDGGSAPAGSYPRLRLTIGNTGKGPCTRDIGADQQELRIMQGSKRIWSSDDCDASHGKDVRLFQPGVRVTFTLAWDGKTSSAGCHRARTVVPPGSYQVVGRVGSKTGQPAPFKLT
jgi:hypothetical protein